MRVGYRCGSVTVDVDTADERSLRWLYDFLQPWVGEVEAGAGRTLVRLTRSDPLFGVLLASRAAAVTRPAPCFALDSRVVVLPGWDAPGALVVCDEELGCFYRFSGTGVEVVARPGHRRSRLGFMRVAREALASAVLEQGGVLDLHAAAFSIDGRCVLVAGRKGAGKTTLVLRALAAGADLVANDRVFVGGGEVDAVAGVPTIVSVRPATLEMFPRLRRHQDERPVSFLESELASSGGRLVGEAAPVRDFALGPSQLASRMGRRRIGGGPLATVLFPIVAPGAGPREAAVVSSQDAVRRLRECFYGSRNDDRTHTLFEAGTDRGQWLTRQTALAERLVAQARCLEVRLGRDLQTNGDRWLTSLAAAWERAAR